mgnify:CR=1 FL=1
MRSKAHWQAAFLVVGLNGEMELGCSLARRPALHAALPIPSRYVPAGQLMQLLRPQKDLKSCCIVLVVAQKLMKTNGFLEMTIALQFETLAVITYGRLIDKRMAIKY